MRAIADLFNRTDPIQPTEAESYAAAEALIEYFDGDLGRARGWAIDEAIRYNADGDRTRNMMAVRLSRAVKELTAVWLTERAPALSRRSRLDPLGDG